MYQRVIQWFKPAPDSTLAFNLQRGRSIWAETVHLLWSVWIFIVPVFDSDGWSLRWFGLTALSYPLFLGLYFKSMTAPREHVLRYGLSMVALSMLLLPWYPSGLTYFVYGCIFLCARRIAIRTYVSWLLGLNAIMLGECWLLHYPWQSVISIPITTLIVSMIISAERLSDAKDAELQLSHEEVRRLAGLAERERIGRDLHDLLGHTLSLITLKLELSRRLFDRDSEAAKREMEEAERVARHALAEVRSAVSGIRAADIAAELASSRLLLESSGVRLEYGVPPIDLPAEVERGLSLVLREAATNIARHARASRAQISFAREPQAVVLRIDDNGRGGVGEDGNGLCGMRERVRALSGTLSIESPRAQGTHMLIRVPTPAMSALAAMRVAPELSGDTQDKLLFGRPAV
jgi:two-component system sensor histidine kinase DesK